MKPLGIYIYLSCAAIAFIGFVFVLCKIILIKKQKLPNQKINWKLTGIGILGMAAGLFRYFTGNGVLSTYIIQYVIIIPSAKVLYEGVKKSKIACILGIYFFALFWMVVLAPIMIGTPNEKPVVHLEDTPLIVGETTVSELLDDGFIILIRGENITERHEDLYIEEIFEKYISYDGNSSYILEPLSKEKTYMYNSILSDTRSTYYIAKEENIYGGLIPVIDEKTELKDAVICQYIFYPTTYGKDLTGNDIKDRMDISLNGTNIFELDKEAFYEMYEEAEELTHFPGKYPEYLIESSNKTTAGSLNNTVYRYCVKFRFNEEYFPEEGLIDVHLLTY